MVVHYTIVLQGDVAGINNETMTDITLESNQVEKSYTEPEELPTVVYTVTDLRHYITQALHKESHGNNGNTSLDVDPDSLQLENGMKRSKKCSSTHVYGWGPKNYGSDDNREDSILF